MYDGSIPRSGEHRITVVETTERGVETFRRVPVLGSKYDYTLLMSYWIHENNTNLIAIILVHMSYNHFSSLHNFRSNKLVNG